MNEEYTKGMSQLLELARDIELNPSPIWAVAGGKGKKTKGIQTPDFDWNVFVGRIDKLIRQEKIANSPFRRCHLVLALLNADLTYDNRSRAKKILQQMISTLQENEMKEQKAWRLDRDLIERDREECLTSPALTDEFWMNAVVESQKCKCECPECKSNATSVEEKRTDVLTDERTSVLEKEKLRYKQLLSSALAF